MDEKKELRECVEKFIDKNEEIIKKLREKVTQIEKHQKDCNIAKTVGTSVGGAGSVASAVGLILAPFTAGWSAVVFLSGGLAAGLGAATNVSTQVADHFISKKFLTEIESLAKERAAISLHLAQRFEPFYIIVQESKDLSLNQDEAPLNANVLKMIAGGGIKVYKLGRTSVKLIKEIKLMNAAKVARSASQANAISSIKNMLSFATAETKGIFMFTY